MAVGYPKRGRRAGVKTRAEQTRKQFNIPVISSPRFQYANPHLTRGVNFNNLLAVSKTKPSHQNRASVHFIHENASEYYVISSKARRGSTSFITAKRPGRMHRGILAETTYY